MSKPTLMYKSKINILYKDVYLFSLHFQFVVQA